MVHWQAADTLIFAGEKCPAVTELLPDGRREFRGVTFFNLGHIDDLWNDGPPPAPTREP